MAIHRKLKLLAPGSSPDLLGQTQPRDPCEAKSPTRRSNVDIYLSKKVAGGFRAPKDHFGLSRSIPILMYHEVTPHPHPAFRKYAITPAKFAAQMRWLALCGYEPISLDDWLTHRNDGTALSPKPVIITFDDGYRDCARYAAPILASYNFKAIFYLVSGYMGRTSRWLLVEKGCEFPLMTWAMARELEAAGFQCGAHSLTHPPLAEISTERCKQELVESRSEAEQHLGHEIRHFAYPYGSHNAVVRAIAAETGYTSACSVRIGLSAADDDVLALHRVPVSGQESLVDFIFRLRTAHSPREWLQHHKHQVRAWLSDLGAD
jgi:peptidoglycan/xylan/chitin deacetylase (PgdA/CDA1 family)